MRKDYWYAIMKDEKDTDTEFGTFNKRYAAQLTRMFRKEGHPNAYIKVIDGLECIDEIYDIRGI